MGKLNQVKERYIFISPTLQAGWEDESNINDFEGSKKLGQGAFGRVIKVLHKKSKLTYAVKEINKKNLKLNNMLEQVGNEVKIMYLLNHPYILKLYNHFEDDINISLVLEFAEGGQLYTKMFRTPEKKFEEKIVAKYIYQLCKGLEYIHKKGIIHRDIKPENILLDKDGNVKLADFGWSNFKQSNEVRTTFCGTLDYLAPEMLDSSHEHDFGVDIWSVGVLCYELQTGFSPFGPKNNQNDADFVDQQTRSNIKNLRFDFPKDFPPLAKDLITKILVKNPKGRLPLKDILLHPWITQIVEGDSEPVVETISSQKTIQKSKLADDFGIQPKTTFTEEEIYQASRPDSIINKEFDETSSIKSNMEPYSKQLGKTNFIQSAGNGDLKQQFIDQLQNEVKKLKATVNSLEVYKQKKDKECDSLKQQLAYFSQSGTAQQAVPDSIIEKLKDKDEKYAIVKKEYDYIKQKYSEQEQTIANLQKKKETIGDDARLNRLEDENLSYRIQIEQLKSELGKPPQSGGKTAIEDMMTRINDYREKNEKQKEEIKKNQEEITKLQQSKSSAMGMSGSSSSSSQNQMGDLDFVLKDLKQKQLQQLNEQNKKKI